MSKLYNRNNDQNIKNNCSLPKHGDYLKEVNENVIVINANGSFNEFGAMDLFADIKSSITQFLGKPFLMLFLMDNFDGATPEAYQLTKIFNLWLNSQKVVAKALVYSGSATKNIDSFWVKTSVRHRAKYFDNEDNARAWLELQWMSHVV